MDAALPTCSIVLPVRDEEAVLPETYRRLTATMGSAGEAYELIFVDDGSRDASREILRGLCARDGAVRMLALSRNFGQQAALTAGVDAARGKAVVLMDCDLQDPPELIPRLIAAWREGNDVVVARRTDRRGETAVKRATARAFHTLLARLSGEGAPRDVGDFRLMDRKVCEALRGCRERDRYFRGLVGWLGFRRAEVPYTREERAGGTTKYTYRKMASLAATAIAATSAAPLRLPIYAGGGLFAAGLAVLGALSMTRTGGGPAVPGAVVCALVLLIGGMILAAIGLLGVYVGKALEEAKGRPLYVVAETAGFPPAAPGATGNRSHNP